MRCLNDARAGRWARAHENEKWRTAKGGAAFVRRGREDRGLARGRCVGARLATRQTRRSSATRAGRSGAVIALRAGAAAPPHTKQATQVSSCARSGVAGASPEPVVVQKSRPSGSACAGVRAGMHGQHRAHEKREDDEEAHEAAVMHGRAFYPAPGRAEAAWDNSRYGKFPFGARRGGRSFRAIRRVPARWLHGCSPAARWSSR